MFGMHDIVHDLAFTGLLLGMLLFACVVPLTRMDLRKGVFSLPGAAAVPFRSSPRPTRSPFSAWARSPRWS